MGRQHKLFPAQGVLPRATAGHERATTSHEMNYILLLCVRLPHIAGPAIGHDKPAFNIGPERTTRPVAATDHPNSQAPGHFCAGGLIGCGERI